MADHAPVQHAGRDIAPEALSPALALDSEPSQPRRIRRRRQAYLPKLRLEQIAEPGIRADHDDGLPALQVHGLWSLESGKKGSAQGGRGDIGVNRYSDPIRPADSQFGPLK